MKKIICLIIAVFALANASLIAGDKVKSDKEFDYTTELNKDFRTAYGKSANSKEVLKDKTILLYFTASWCPPCRAFTPILVKFAKKHADNIVVVVVSEDRNKKDAIKYMRHKRAKAFYMIPPGKQAAKLSEKFGITGIPSVVVISKNGAILSKNARSQISSSNKLPAEWK